MRRAKMRRSWYFLSRLGLLLACHGIFVVNSSLERIIDRLPQRTEAEARGLTIPSGGGDLGAGSTTWTRLLGAAHLCSLLAELGGEARASQYSCYGGLEVAGCSLTTEYGC